MSISKKDTIIEGAAGKALLIVIMLVVCNQPQPITGSRIGPVTSGIFKRCDGFSGPIEQIEISTCPDRNEVGYCKIRNDDFTLFFLTFTPKKDIAEVGFAVTGPNNFKFHTAECTPQSRLECPCKAGKAQEIWEAVTLDGVEVTNSTQLQLKVYDSSSKTEDVVYCVEFPAKIVRSAHSHVAPNDML